MRIALVAAVADNGVIGRDGGLPWRLPADLRRFKALTMGKPMIMGRRTFAAIGRPLPGRLNIVVTRDPAFAAPGAVTARSLDGAFALAREALALQSPPGREGEAEVAVIGGAEIYAQALPAADRLNCCRGGRVFASVLLALSVMSATYPTWNPWTHPWLWNFLYSLGWIS